MNQDLERTVDVALISPEPICLHIVVPSPDATIGRSSPTGQRQQESLGDFLELLQQFSQYHPVREGMILQTCE